MTTNEKSPVQTAFTLHSLVARFFTVSLPKIVFADGKVLRLELEGVFIGCGGNGLADWGNMGDGFLL
jgi:hypothetical protein